MANEDLSTNPKSKLKSRIIKSVIGAAALAAAAGTGYYLGTPARQELETANFETSRIMRESSKNTADYQLTLNKKDTELKGVNEKLSHSNETVEQDKLIIAHLEKQLNNNYSSNVKTNKQVLINTTKSVDSKVQNVSWRHPYPSQEKGLGKLSLDKIVLDTKTNTATQNLLKGKNINLKDFVINNKDNYNAIIKTKSGETIYGSIGQDKITYNVSTAFNLKDIKYFGIRSINADSKNNVEPNQWIASVKYGKAEKQTEYATKPTIKPAPKAVSKVDVPRANKETEKIVRRFTEESKKLYDTTLPCDVVPPNGIYAPNCKTPVPTDYQKITVPEQKPIKKIETTLESRLTPYDLETIKACQENIDNFTIFYSNLESDKKEDRTFTASQLVGEKNGALSYLVTKPILVKTFETVQVNKKRGSEYDINFLRAPVISNVHNVRDYTASELAKAKDLEMFFNKLTPSINYGENPKESTEWIPLKDVKAKKFESYGTDFYSDISNIYIAGHQLNNASILPFVKEEIKPVYITLSKPNEINPSYICGVFTPYSSTLGQAVKTAVWGAAAGIVYHNLIATHGAASTTTGGAAAPTGGNAGTVFGNPVATPGVGSGSAGTVFGNAITTFH